MVNRDIVRLLHIRDAVIAVEGYAAVGYERFSAEALTQDAIIWQLEVMCEAIKRLSAELRNSHPIFRSRQMSRLQEEFDHNFLDIDLQVVWDVTQEALPELKRTVEAILDEAHVARPASSAPFG